MRLVESVNLKIEEASLTGESVPVEKNAGRRAGQGNPPGRPQEYRLHEHADHLRARRGLVTGTGMNTQIGLIAEMLQSYEDEDTPLQQKAGRSWARFSARPAWPSARSSSSTASSATRI